jgi:hypothetical protein
MLSNLESLNGEVVVLDMRAHYVIVGTLAAAAEDHLELQQADVHDLRDTSTTREIYVLESKRLGVRPNRDRVLVRCDEIVSLSRLDDVLE